MQRSRRWFMKATGTAGVLATGGGSLISIVSGWFKPKPKISVPDGMLLHEGFYSTYREEMTKAIKLGFKVHRSDAERDMYGILQDVAKGDWNA